MIDFAFENRDILSIVTRNAPEWPEQLAPLKSLELTPVGGKLGELEMTKACWEKIREE